MTSSLNLELDAVSRALQRVHKEILEAEGAYLPGRSALTLLDRLLNDPEWAWLRALSNLIANLDEALAEDEDVTPTNAAIAAGRVRALVFGLGEPRDEGFLDRYRPLLQVSAALASAHGELKRLVDALPGS
jgi:tRNA A-37 threonylcarbamoyl transferase component Bud32